MREFIIKYWLQVGFTAIVSFLSMYIGNISKKYKQALDKYNKECDDQQLLKTGLQAILRDRLTQIHAYHMNKGYCSMNDKSNIQNMYNSYHSLGLNGVMDNSIKECLDLPIRSKE